MESWKKRAFRLEFLIRPPGTVVPRRPYVSQQFFIFSMQGSSADRCKILHHAQKHVQFYNSRPKIWGLHPKKIWGQKHSKFGSISHPIPLWVWISPERI